MKKLLVLLMLVCSSTFCNNTHYHIVKPVRYTYTIDKMDICKYPTIEVLAAIAYHECGNLSKLDRWLTMEAVWNRVVTNFNKNGYCLESQLLAPKQFTGLWKYRPEDLKFDSTDPICLENLHMAKLIVAGNRYWKYEPIVYWAGKNCDRNTAHYRNIETRQIETGYNLQQIYATE